MYVSPPLLFFILLMRPLLILRGYVRVSGLWLSKDCFVRVRCRRTLLHDRDMLSCGNHLQKLLADNSEVCALNALDQAARRTLTLVLAVFGGWSLSRDRNSRNRQYFRGAKSLVCALASLSGWRALVCPGGARDLKMAGRQADTSYHWPISAAAESFSSNFW